MTKRSCLWLFAASTAIALLIPGTVSAQQTDWERHPYLTTKFRLSAGGFFSAESTKIAINGSLFPDNPEYDFESLLRVDEYDSRPSGELRWRFGEKWMVALQYLDSSQAETFILPYDIRWGDLVLQEGSSVSMGVSSEVMRMFFGRKFSVGDKYEFGAGAGVHWLELGAYAEGLFFLNDIPLGFDRKNVSAKAPLPNVGVWYDYAFNQRWIMNLRVDYLSASVGDYSGGLTNAQAGVSYQAWEHFALGLSYNYLNVNVDVDSGTWKGSVDATRAGPFVFMTFTW